MRSQTWGYDGSACRLTATGPEDEDLGRFVSGQILVGFMPDVPPGEVDAIVEHGGGTILDEREHPAPRRP